MKRQSKPENKHGQNPTAGSARHSHRICFSVIRFLFALLLFSPAAFAQQVFSGTSTSETTRATPEF